MSGIDGGRAEVRVRSVARSHTQKAPRSLREAGRRRHSRMERSMWIPAQAGCPAVFWPRIRTPDMTEHRDPSGGVRGRTEGAEGALSGINVGGGPWSCEGLMPQCRGKLEE